MNVGKSNQQLCRTFCQTGFCPHGDSCQFLHVAPSPGPPQDFMVQQAQMLALQGMDPNVSGTLLKW